MTRRADLEELPGGLWTVSIKLRALGEVFSMANGEPPFGEEALKGMSSLLCGMADELVTIRETLEYPERDDQGDDGNT
jgi:hypothetical protein